MGLALRACALMLARPLHGLAALKRMCAALVASLPSLSSSDRQLSWALGTAHTAAACSL